MSAITDEMLADIEKETVDFGDNYDGRRASHRSCRPPAEPAGQRQLGIAVGMATNIPPHNLHEIADAVNALIENPASPWTSCRRS